MNSYLSSFQYLLFSDHFIYVCSEILYLPLLFSSSSPHKPNTSSKFTTFVVVIDKLPSPVSAAHICLVVDPSTGAWVTSYCIFKNKDPPSTKICPLLVASQ